MNFRINKVWLRTMLCIAILFLLFAFGVVIKANKPAKKVVAEEIEILDTQLYISEEQDDRAESNIIIDTDNRNEEPNEVTTTDGEDTESEEITVTEDKTVEEDSCTQHYTEQDAIDIAKVLYHECRGIQSKTEQACVAWTILNRVDCYNSTVYSVVRAPNQFAFYEDTPVWDELLNLSRDVLDRWSCEQNGETNVGRVLAPEYIYFEGRDGHNYFRDNYSGEYNIWEYTLESPYEN